MAAPKNFITGFNHNVQHRGASYHVQTEDSGTEHGHIITHLFQGGNIIASKKTSYKEVIGAPNLQDLVRTLMEEQHKEMLRNLVNGVYDSPASDPASANDPKGERPQGPPPIPEKAAWPWSAKGRPAVPPAFPSQREPKEFASWPAGKGKPMPPPLPGSEPEDGDLPDVEVDLGDFPPSTRRLPRDDDAPTLYSEDLVSDRSLDEVILRYLSGEKE